MIYPYPGAGNPDAYELLNLCTDPDQRIEKAIHAIAPIEGKVLIDIGAGSGFHAVRYSQTAVHVFALEPDPLLLQLLFARLSREAAGNVSVLAAGAESIPLPSQSVDLAIARFAYFFGTQACLPGFRKVKQILKPGGHFFIIDADPDRGQFGALARQAYPDAFHASYTSGNRAFYASLGFEYLPVDTVFRAPDREAIKAVFQMDYPHAWERLLAQVAGLEISYGISLYHYQRRIA